MHARIETTLDDLIAQENIRVLFAIESGSRAWGFPSPDSDYDVRFVYARERSWYLKLFEGRDVLEVPIDKELDLGGWDLKKALALAVKSNPVIWEWLQSPIIYRAEPGFMASMLQVLEPHFSPKSALHHYLAMAAKGLEELVAAEEVRLKRYFYVIRPLLAADWIATKNSVPPMTVDELLTLEEENSAIVAIIRDLIDMKSELDESATLARIEELDAFLLSKRERCERFAEKAKSVKHPVESLDEFFQDVVG
ncbi:MAG: nucleotidyltransferase domain-containing protein [Bdellovibrionales bacterium]|nr:nucleotidyltransferase domain-containing protein [Bdellovibrionales bacterium]